MNWYGDVKLPPSSRMILSTSLSSTASRSSAYLSANGSPARSPAVDLRAVHGEPGLSQSAGVALRIEDKEVLIVDREANHPTSQLHGIGDLGVTRQPVKLEQLSNQTSDLAVGVVRTEDDLDHMSNSSFDQPEEFGGW